MTVEPSGMNVPAYFRPKYTPLTLMSMTLNHSAGSESAMLATGSITPALDTKTSTAPNLAIAFSNSAFTSSAFDTSVVTARALSSPMAAAISLILASDLAASTTPLAPCSAKYFTAAAPIPFDAPVTMITLPTTGLAIARAATRSLHLAVSLTTSR